MTALMIFLPIAISALIAIIVGFRYARVERERMQRVWQEQHPQDSEPYLPFAEAIRSRMMSR